jgi:hypothetical protein
MVYLMRSFFVTLASSVFVLLNVFCKPTTEKIAPILADTVSTIRTTITLHRRGCEGTCPAYTLTFDGKEPGKAHYVQTYPENKHRDTSYVIDENSVRGICAKIEHMGFWQLSDKYIHDDTFDLPTTVINISNENGNKEIIFNGNQPILDSLSAMIDRVGKVNVLFVDR